MLPVEEVTTKAQIDETFYCRDALASYSKLTRFLFILAMPPAPGYSVASKLASELA